MPTGYTYKVQEGQSFNDFVWTCAKAFGAFIDMRDSPNDAAIPEKFEPSSYHADALKKSVEKKALLREMSDADCDLKAIREYESEVAETQESEKRRLDGESKYKTMIANVYLWEPPTPDHLELKTFMLSQLSNSVNFDCKSYEKPAIEKLSGSEWRSRKMERIVHNIEYHTKESKKEIERVNGRNQWIQDLRGSVPTI